MAQILEPVYIMLFLRKGFLQGENISLKTTLVSYNKRYEYCKPTAPIPRLYRNSIRERLAHREAFITSPILTPLPFICLLCYVGPCKVFTSLFEILHQQRWRAARPPHEPGVGLMDGSSLCASTVDGLIPRLRDPRPIDLHVSSMLIELNNLETLSEYSDMKQSSPDGSRIFHAGPVFQPLFCVRFVKRACFSTSAFVISFISCQ